MNSISPSTPGSPAIQGAVMVAQAQADLPGLGTICSELSTPAKRAWSLGTEARIQRMEICRKLCIYGETPAVKAALERINTPADGPRRGRPKQAHRLAMEALSEKSGVPMRTLQFWMRDWLRVAEQLDIARTFGTPLSDFCASLAQKSGAPSIEVLLDNLHGHHEDGQEEASQDLLELPPEKFASAVAAPIRRKICKMLHTRTGHPRALPPTHRKAIRDALNSVLDVAGLVVMDRPNSRRASAHNA